MKISTTIGFNGDPKKLAKEARDLESAGVDLIWGAEIYGYDLISTLGYLAGQTSTVQLMTGHHPALLAQPGADRPDGGDARRAVGRPVRVGPRHVGSAGDRRLARGAVREADRPHPRHDRDLSQGVEWRQGRVPGLRVPAPPRRGRHRARQADQVHEPAAGQGHPDRPRHDRSQERRAHRRDRRHLADDPLRPRPLPAGVGRRARRRNRQARPEQGAARDHRRGHRRARLRRARRRGTRGGSRA